MKWDSISSTSWSSQVTTRHSSKFCLKKRTVMSRHALNALSSQRVLARLNATAHWVTDESAALCVLCVLCVVDLFSALGGPRWRYITADISQAWPSMTLVLTLRMLRGSGNSSLASEIGLAWCHSGLAKLVSANLWDGTYMGNIGYKEQTQTQTQTGLLRQLNRRGEWQFWLIFDILSWSTDHPGCLAQDEILALQRGRWAWETTKHCNWISANGLLMIVSPLR